jgi:murein DD-endopeptidase MepM/ murein hydrolase activator NlpD
MRYWLRHLRRPPAAAAIGAGLLAGLAMALGGPGWANARTADGIGSHIVRSGDTVQSVADRYGVDAADIRVANGIIDDRLYVGARLLIDGTAAPSTSSARPSASTYEVQPGDALIRIARSHGVSLSDLLEANDLRVTSFIFPGDQLTVPGSGGADSTGGGGVPRPRVVCPVPSASFMNSWGFPRGSSRFHEGTDLMAPAGTTILAPITGTMTFDRNNLGGRTFTITSPSGWVAYGAHLEDQIGESRQVAAGEVIGTVGDSGNAKGGDPHLHLSLERGGTAVNPYPSLSDAC